MLRTVGRSYAGTMRNAAALANTSRAAPISRVLGINTSSPPGLTRWSIVSRRAAWIAGSSPAMTKHSRGAECVRVLQRRQQRTTTKKREAKRRKAQASHCRASRHGSAPYRGALAFRRFAAALAPASERQNSAQAALHASGRMRALPAPSFALKRGTSHPGHHAGGDDARTARERGYKPRPQEPHSLHDQVCLETTSLR